MTSPVSHMSKDSSLRNTYVAMDTNSFLLFKPALYSTTLLINFKSSMNLFISQNSYCNTIGQSYFIKALLPTWHAHFYD